MRLQPGSGHRPCLLAVPPLSCSHPSAPLRPPLAYYLPQPLPAPPPLPTPPRRFSDSDVQRDRKLVSYDIIDKGSKPYVQGEWVLRGVRSAGGQQGALSRSWPRSALPALRAQSLPYHPPHPSPHPCPLPCSGGGRREEGLLPRGDLRHDPHQDEGHRRGVPGQVGQARRRHGARLLQRRAAPGHQGTRAPCWVLGRVRCTGAGVGGG